jgi:AraC-like DNA-binding protein
MDLLEQILNGLSLYNALQCLILSVILLKNTQLPANKQMGSILIMLSIYCLASSKMVLNLFGPFFSGHIDQFMAFFHRLLGLSIIFVIVKAFEQIGSRNDRSSNTIFIGGVLLTILLQIQYQEEVFYPIFNFEQHRSIASILVASIGLLLVSKGIKTKKDIKLDELGMHKRASFKTLVLFIQFSINGLIIGVGIFVIFTFFISDFRDRTREIFFLAINIHVLVIVLWFSFVAFRYPQTYLALFIEIKNKDLAFTVRKLINKFNKEGYTIKAAPEVLHLQNFMDSEPDSSPASNIKTNKSQNEQSVEDPLPAQTVQRVTDYIENQKIFLKNNCNPKTIASELNMPTYHIRKAIKQKYDSSFAKYINFLRIREAENILNSDQYNHYTISSIAEMCGFNSDTAFYRNFKKFAEANPSDYRDN